MDPAPGITRTSEVLVKFMDQTKPEFIEIRSVRRAPKPGYVFFGNGARRKVAKYTKGGAMVNKKDGKDGGNKKDDSGTEDGSDGSDGETPTKVHCLLASTHTVYRIAC